MKRLRFWILFLLLLAACTPRTQKQMPVRKTYPYVVKVTDFNGAGGVGVDYYVSKTSIVVVQWDDFGSPPREVLNRELTDVEREEWNTYLSTLDIDLLEDEYEDPTVYDGLQRTYHFRLDGNNRRIDVRNCYVPELSDLFERIRGYLPDDLKPRWSTFSDDHYSDSELESESQNHD